MIPVHKLVDEVLDLVRSDENLRRIKQRQALMARRKADFVPAIYVRLNRPYVAARTGINLREMVLQVASSG
ncbi:MAG: hypothetical protein M1546_01115 [Chloroflexi bacterium]|nr:hypothetical protein [Chloroflexota bacterium]